MTETHTQGKETETKTRPKTKTGQHIILTVYLDQGPDTFLINVMGTCIVVGPFVKGQVPIDTQGRKVGLPTGGGQYCFKEP